MRLRIAAAATAFAVLAAADSLSAQATELRLYAVNPFWSDAEWTGTGWTNMDNVANDGSNSISLRWGKPTIGNNQSSYQFNNIVAPGAQVQYPNDFVTVYTNGSLFKVGTFTHKNYPITTNSLQSVDLNVALTFDTDGAAPNTVVSDGVTISHYETNNPNGDVVTFLGLPSMTSFQIDGFWYDLRIEGFSYFSSARSVDDLIETFTTPESFKQEYCTKWKNGKCKEKDWKVIEKLTTGHLYASVTARPVNVPEPTSLSLVGFGAVAMFGFARRNGRRNG
ncbi:MAG: PEP-CTERM sorting domain-containing protein [Gemmatimonadaceae bacterium]|nr:PEP-CTERM sorting domain-containing protein [Gemmatimonadaceae bacterium]